MSSSPERFVIAITGASGAVYATRLLQLLSQTRCEVYLTISTSGAAVIKQELGLDVDIRRPNLERLLGYLPHWAESSHWQSTAESASDSRGKIHFYQFDDYMTPIASGSFRTSAMVICPCSGSTLSAISRAAASNLITRAAEVHLKEHRKLVLVPRETPLSVLQLENMQRLAAAGAIVLPAMPGWYHGVDSLEAMVDFVVCRILDQLGVDNDLMKRWGDS